MRKYAGIIAVAMCLCLIGTMLCSCSSGSYDVEITVETLYGKVISTSDDSVEFETGSYVQGMILGGMGDDKFGRTDGSEWEREDDMVDPPSTPGGTKPMASNSDEAVGEKNTDSKDDKGSDKNTSVPDGTITSDEASDIGGFVEQDNRESGAAGFNDMHGSGTFSGCGIVLTLSIKADAVFKDDENNEIKVSDIEKGDIVKLDVKNDEIVSITVMTGAVDTEAFDPSNMPDSAVSDGENPPAKPGNRLDDTVTSDGGNDSDDKTGDAGDKDEADADADSSDSDADEDDDDMADSMENSGKN